MPEAFAVAQMTHARLHAGFLVLLPKIERHARFAHRHLHSYHDREDAVAETVALAWAWYASLIRRGKDPASFATTLASYASRHVKIGRQLCGQENTRDALSPSAGQRRGFRTEPLQTHGPNEDASWQEALADNTRAPVPDQAAFRIDFPAWLTTLGGKARKIVEAMAVNDRTTDLAGKFRLSPGRISQLRREFHHSWQHFGRGFPPAQQWHTMLTHTNGEGEDED